MQTLGSKILLVSYSFPPLNAISTLRVRSFAEYLHRKGCLSGVLTVTPNPHLMRDLSTEVPEEKIIRGAFVDMTHLGIKTGTSAKQRLMIVLRKWLKKIYIPDGKIFWLLPLIKDLKWVVSEKDIDCLLVSAGPFTAVLAAFYMKHKYKLPYVVDLRDPWADNPHEKKVFPFNLLNRLMEKYCLRQAAAIITVSEPLAERYRNRYGKPVYLIYNGYDERDFHHSFQKNFEKIDSPSNSTEKLTICYTGCIYDEMNLKALVTGILRFSAENPAKDLDIALYGGPIAGNAYQQLGRLPRGQVRFSPRCEHREALLLQQQADVLLFIQSWGKDFEGVLSGKIWEYLRSGKPILNIGESSSYTARFLKVHFGVDTCETADDVSRFLWQVTKAETGRPHYAQLKNFERQRQAERLDKLFDCSG